MLYSLTSGIAGTESSLDMQNLALLDPEPESAH